jgi:putative transposase
MARLPRLVVPHQPHHIVQTGIDGQPVFRDDADYQAFLGWLREAARQFKVAIHAYALLPGQVQLLASPADPVGLARMMQWIGRQYVPYFNAKYLRAGTLWQGRYRATVIESAQYFLPCSRYIESEPVRAGFAPEVESYRWSSYAHHAGMQSDPIITDHAAYWALGNTPFDREAAYKSLMEQGLSMAEVKTFGEAARKGWPLGSDKFKTELEKQVNRRVKPSRRGRPAKPRVTTLP